MSELEQAYICLKFAYAALYWAMKDDYIIDGDGGDVT